MAHHMYEAQSSKRMRKNEDRNYFPSNFNAGYPSDMSGEEERPNNILLLTIINASYAINCDILHQICSPSGKVIRIVIFRKRGTQALVEFDSIDSARRAKLALNGCDIFTDCCTLRVEFAKTTRLNVYKNDHESFDYTNPGLDGSFPGYGRAPNRHHQQQFIAGPESFVPGGAGEAYSMDRSGMASVGGAGRAYAGNGAASYTHAPLISATPTAGIGQGAVMMIYGLNLHMMNCDRLFNLLCQYGNVIRVKFLKSKENCAMAQMGDPSSVERAIAALNKASFFGSEVEFATSKQSFLNDVPKPFDLPDGTVSFKDYLNDRNNRFASLESAAKNRPSSPCEVLHFFNAPPGFTDAEIHAIFDDRSPTSKPLSVKFLQSKSERSSSGLILFDTVTDAIEALILCNHVSIEHPNGKFPYIFKLCFSHSASRHFNVGEVPAVN